MYAELNSIQFAPWESFDVEHGIALPFTTMLRCGVNVHKSKTVLLAIYNIIYIVLLCEVKVFCRCLCLCDMIESWHKNWIILLTEVREMVFLKLIYLIQYSLKCWYFHDVARTARLYISEILSFSVVDCACNRNYSVWYPTGMAGKSIIFSNVMVLTENWIWNVSNITKSTQIP